MMPILSIRTRRPGGKDGLVARAAYCGRRRLRDWRRGRVFDCSQRPGLAWSELSLPAALAAHPADPERLWNTMEGPDARGVGACAYELVMGLPRGRPLPAHAAFVRHFLDEACVARGRAVDWHIHYDKCANLHAHALASPTWPPVTSGMVPARSGHCGERLALRAQWRRHCARWGLTHDTAASHPVAVLPGRAQALARRGVATRQGQHRAALQALAARPAGRRWQAWSRLRWRQRMPAGRERIPWQRQDLARDR
ncbi:MobA/MobL family protein [Acidiferrobacter sp. SPIII_3]|jgi:hypothetical protein|uniref:MobA/MobL family protein n=1 Tax=Acidiferrobacter sp. SPIII_3 TaxID=1281578 RepID=UPI00143E0884|nr:MobA/MobL family protein [Acidiferrobacter sp. SPIII_3]